MHLDTCFLIDLFRETLRHQPSHAQTFIEQHAGAAFSISVIAALEFEEGFGDDRLDEARSFLAPFEVLPVDRLVASRGARVRRALRQSGLILGDHDTLIAATALHCDEPLVTDNLIHFGRVPGLRVIRYKS
ncbi:MAG: hypothetical protein A3K19_12665 [Lentisphaerae bacterium RIFOXYB12_FULL_65_16]|nr:MAG: hypothetical protein A3K18_24385 [Lentisphaerae bacterium RIFOXYA12_64_32]OGV88076.1 MAG: hypothetical protein A3K19_12665 [Lentisphaerae bacterium RIFOXYB12_FULL_65_16]